VGFGGNCGQIGELQFKSQGKHHPITESGMPATTASNSISGGGDKSELWFPFAEGIPFAATLWMGAEGFHMTVNGRHISSFQYCQVWMPSSIVIPNGLKSVKVFNLSPTSRILQCIAAGQLF
jgi:hypothetical protein